MFFGRSASTWKSGLDRPIGAPLRRRPFVGRILVETSADVVAEEAGTSFLLRHQFLIYRLFSLAGIVPIGGYMVTHLLTNATILNDEGAHSGVASFQSAVDRIHSLGVILPAVEWTFIFLPLMFHAGIGWLIISGAVPNTNQYRYTSNIRYVLQRGTGIIAFFYIVFHVIHLHHLGGALGGGKFAVEDAASSTGAAIQAALWVRVVYVVGVLACVYHFCNGLWTWGITWGIWITPAAQRRANWISILAGVFLTTVGLSALWGFSRVDVAKARMIEQHMEREKLRIMGDEAMIAAPPPTVSGLAAEATDR
jgi:succinate dehydrogenase / fumarate reductase, cytochrome b subunit